jgi:hypothetical protein
MLPSELDCPPMTRQGSRDGEFRDVANLRHRAKHLRYHAKDEQRFVVSVIAYDSLPGHQRSHPYPTPINLNDFVSGLQEVFQRTLRERTKCSPSTARAGDGIWWSVPVKIVRGRPATIA